MILRKYIFLISIVAIAAVSCKEDEFLFNTTVTNDTELDIQLTNPTSQTVYLASGEKKTFKSDIPIGIYTITARKPSYRQTTLRY